MACSVSVALKTRNQKDDHERHHFWKFINQTKPMKHKRKYYGLSLLTASAALLCVK